MCGLTGFYSITPFPESIAQGMAATLHHRGPDDAGIWSDSGITLAHRRLAILDLSPAGHQPMPSNNGRYVIVFNGEIYNYLELRQQLPTLHWRGTSDTETLLACIECWGIERTLQRSVGMFAIALWDREQQQLTLARDRMGEKPLYYGWQGNTFLFGSELKALKAHPDCQAEVSRPALTLLLRHNYIPVPYTIYQGIYKLPSGTYLTLTPANTGQLSQPIPYWSLHAAVQHAQQNPFMGTEQEAIDTLERTLQHAVQQQQLADVPLGAFLSGGIDSSTIIALMQANATRPINTFTIGMESQTHNEAEHAKAVARHLGTHHTELYVSAQDALDLIPRLPSLYDEPFADSSQIPTFLVAQLARQHVTVALSGDGGDELFAGYNRYFWGERIWNKMAWMPPAMRSILAKSITKMSVSGWDSLNERTKILQPHKLRNAQLGDKLHKLAERLATVNNMDDLYYSLVSEWKQPTSIVLHSEEPTTLLTSPNTWPNLPDSRERMMYLDSMTYLPDDILAKVDRAAMGVSLETRVPLLDHRVVELAWKIPMHMKIRDGQGKWLLRQVLYRHVPKELIERPKMGFSIPVETWLRGPLRDWAEDLLDETKLKQQGYFNPKPIRQRWQEHLNGSRNWYYSLWSILMFQAWLNTNQSEVHNAYQ